MPPPPVLELVVLGSGGPGAVGRASSSFVVLLDGIPRILIDAGSGAFARLGETKLSLDRLDRILLTHLHIDHSAELPGIFKARAVASRGAINFHVFGPSGAGKFPSTKRFVDLLFGKHGAFAYLADFSAPITIVTTDIGATLSRTRKLQTLLAKDGLKITAIAGHHDDAPSIIYRIDYKNRSVVFSGDIDAAGLDNLRSIADHCNLLVFNTVVLDRPQSAEALYTLHTPPKSIGEVAASAHVGALLLTHLNPAIDQAHDDVLASIHRNYAGPVTFAEDRLRIAP
ncbi:MBL fold metallo-hydrolase [Pseudolysobacter antarcticus]|uniref:MBL fold metallo-hydrolase n=2 Tax=Pseudolysobacter antarcticus TaxID=2511995 RepID=A0A411HQC1_9GAMM|nr:MBL fold metallo-hydrolase [Pseudolysobacter antarcticus]